MTRAGISALCALAVAAGLAGCGGGGGKAAATTQAAPKLRIGYAYSADAGDVGDKVALDRLSARTGMTFVFKEMGGPPNAVVALARGDIDLANLAYLSTLEAIRHGAPIEAVLGSNMASEFLFVGRRGITSPTQLAGKQVAFDYPGQDGEALVKLVLEHAGVSPGKAHLSSLPDSPVRAAALGAGRVDAAELEFVDFHRLATHTPGLTVLGRMTDFKPRSPQTVWAVRRSWAAKHPALLRQVVSGLLDGYRFVYTPAGRAAWIRKARSTVLAGDPAELVSSTYDYYRSIAFWPRAGEPVTQPMHDRVLRFWRSTGQLDGSLPFGKMWDPTPWQNAARR